MTTPSDAGTSDRTETEPRFEDRLFRLLWLTLFIVVAGWSVIYVSWPFSTDQGMLSWVGDVIRRGGTPYQDTWETRGPLPYFFYALIAAATGPNEWALRIVDLLFVALAAFSIRHLTRTLEQPLAAQVAVVIYLLWYAGLNHHNAAQSDGWNAAFLAGAVALLLGGGPRPSAIATAAAGMAFGLCMLSKPTYGIMLTIPLLQGIGIARRHGSVALVKYWSAGAVGLIVAIAACLGWYAQRGALDEIARVDVGLALNQRADGVRIAHYPALSAGWLNRAHYMLQYLSAGPFTAAIPFALVGIGSLSRRRPDAALVLGTWLACALVTVMLQGEFFPYHWHPVFPPLALVTGLGVHASYIFWKERSAPALARLFPATLLVLVIAASIEPAMHLYRWVSVVAGVSAREDYERIEFGPYGKRTGVFSQVTRHVREHSDENDPILVWGNPAGIYYLANRKPVSRFGYPAALLGKEDDFSRRYRVEFLAAMRSGAPRRIVSLDDAVCARAGSIEARKLIGKAEGLMECLTAFPALRAFADSAYRLDQRFGNVVVWRLK